ncbi:MAG: adenylate/guanylate cyclase domain-containing protein [Candidatus Odinarchaeota archaeon]
MTTQSYVKDRYNKVLQYDIPASQLTVRQARSIPNIPNDVGYKEVVVMDLAIVFADVRGYTKRIEGANPKVAARLMSIYVTEMAAAIRHHGGTIVSIEGDGIIGAFDDSGDENGPTAAVRSVVTMNTLLEFVVNKRLSAFQQQPLSCGYGVDHGRLHITRAGIHGEGKNELVFVGSPMTRAAKYQAKAQGNELYISKRVYDAIEEFYRNNWGWSSTHTTEYGTLYKMNVNHWTGTEEP